MSCDTCNAIERKIIEAAMDGSIGLLNQHVQALRKERANLNKIYQTLDGRGWRQTPGGEK
jgi:hypothetical protein